jgi:hypothetical protein
MPPWEIRPFEGIGPISFGMSRSALRESLGNGFHSLWKSRKAPFEVDAYDTLDLHFYHDSGATLRYIEAFRETQAHLGHVRLFADPFSSIIAAISQGETPFALDTSGCDFVELGLTIYTPLPDRRVESIGLFRRDKMEQRLQLLRRLAENDRRRAEERAKHPIKNPFAGMGGKP